MAMQSCAQGVLRFGRFSLDLGRGLLHSTDSEIFLRPKTFEVLCFLAANAGRIVPKRELDDAVWPNVAVTDASLAQCIRELRDKLDDSDRTLIRTVHRRGYMLDVMVTKELAGPATTAIRSATAVEEERGAIKASEGPPSLGMTAFEADRVPEGRVADMQPSASTPRSPPTVATAPPADRFPADPLGDLFGARTRSHARGGWARIVAVAVASVVALGSAAYWFSRSGPPNQQAGKAIELSIQPYTMFRDCGACPEMVVLPAGEFDIAETAKSRKRITIPGPIAVGRFEVSVEQFAAFVDQTKFDIGSKCNIVSGSGQAINLQTEAEGSFRQQPNIRITARHPAACVSWHDAKAYAAWLAGKTGKPYRLLSDAEWEYAARAGTTGHYSFEGGIAKLCEYARFADLDSPFPWASGCHSGNPERGPLPVGSLKPNPWGLFDVHGNLWEWVEDCLSSDAEALPVMGPKALPTDSCKFGIMRGGAWVASGRRVDVGFRLDSQTRSRHQSVGFRIALTIDR
jgi:formylglycine-generating enzyme required for sulfatase activity/DNA-binding winged helix-turn-helix (wHTH) protein